VEEQQNHRKDVVYYTNHGIHVLRTLTLKRQSLTNGVTAFEMMCHSCTSLLASILHYYSPFTTTYSTTSKDGVASRKNQSIASSASFRSTALQEILKHFFLQYIHLRDGVILLTSGECRHTADAVLARRSSSSSSSRSSTFPSQLTNPIQTDNHNKGSTSGSKRDDGYTQLYSSNCGYSGYGWDEFHNEDIGIKRRLLESLRHLHYPSPPPSSASSANNEQHQRNDIWDTLLENGAQGFDSAFDVHEGQMKELHRSIEDVRRMFCGEVERILLAPSSMALDGLLVRSQQAQNSTSGRRWQQQQQQRRNGVGSAGGVMGGGGGGKLIIMVTEDKFEKLQLHPSSTSTTTTTPYLDDLAEFSIQRQGDAFKGKCVGGGAVPTHASVEDWRKIMKLTSRLEQIEGEVRRKRTGGSSSKMMGGVKVSGSDGGGGVKKKRRLVIEDDTDSDDDEDNNDNNGSNNANVNTNNKGEEEIASFCLKVTVTKKTHPNHHSTIDPSSSNPSSSLHEIKRQLGVNVQELQRAREGLEEEEKGSKELAYADEVGEGLDSNGGGGVENLMARRGQREQRQQEVSEEMYELCDLIMEERENVQMFRGVCKRKTGMDCEEAWDARESLRESIMTLGILLLKLSDATTSFSTHNNHDSTSSTTALVQQAKSCFEEAIGIIQELERMNRRQSSSSSSSLPFVTKDNNEAEQEHESQKSFKTRALLLCRGRALTNIGRTHFEQARGVPKLTPTMEGGIDGISRGTGDNDDSGGGVCLIKAVRYLRNAEECARSLRAQAVVGVRVNKMPSTTSTKKSSRRNDRGAEQHKIEADILESLAGRWEAHALWSLSKRKECIKVLRKAAGSCGDGHYDDVDDGHDDGIDGNDEDNDDSVGDIEEAKISLLVEWYESAGALVLAATSAMGPIPTVAKGGGGTTKDEKDFEDVAIEGYDRAATISDRLVTLMANRCGEGGAARGGNTTFEDLMRNHDIATGESIRQMRDNFTKDIKRYSSDGVVGGVERSGAPPVALQHANSGRRSLFQLPRNDVATFKGSTANENTGFVVVDGGSGNVRARQRRVRASSAPSNGGDGGPQDAAFDNFNVCTGKVGSDDDDDEGSEEIPLAAYIPWGDEVVLAMGKNPSAYPACEPERPLEMIRELNLQCEAS